MVERQEESPKAVAERLEISREALGYPSQTAFVKAISRTMPMTIQRWNNYVSGRQPITIGVAQALCDRFDLSLDWIYRGERGGLRLRLVQKIDAVTAARSRRQHQSKMTGEQSDQFEDGITLPASVSAKERPAGQPSLDAMLEKAPEELREMAVDIVKRLLGKTP